MEYKASDIKILDGGSGCEAIEICKDKMEIVNHKCWSSKLLYDDQNIVRQVYRNFINAGSEVITSLSYQANPYNMSSSFNITIEEAEGLLMDSVLLAKEEVRLTKSKNKSVLVAASIGPYGAHLSDGSEYSGDYINKVPLGDITDMFRHIIGVLNRTEPDIVAFETIPTMEEVKIIIELLREFPNLKAWISMSSFDGIDTVHGDNLLDIVDLVNKTDEKLIAFGVNCSINLLRVQNAVQRIRQRLTPEKLVILYPGDGKQYMDDTKRFSFPKGINNDTFYDLLPSWIDAGARWIGGCCMMGSKEMVKVAEIINGIRRGNESL